MGYLIPGLGLSWKNHKEEIITPWHLYDRIFYLFYEIDYISVIYNY